MKQFGNIKYNELKLPFEVNWFVCEKYSFKKDLDLSYMSMIIRPPKITLKGKFYDLRCVIHDDCHEYVEISEHESLVSAKRKAGQFVKIFRDIK